MAETFLIYLLILCFFLFTFLSSLSSVSPLHIMMYRCTEFILYKNMLITDSGYVYSRVSDRIISFILFGDDFCIMTRLNTTAHDNRLT